jgi:hypothetical protein
MAFDGGPPACPAVFISYAHDDEHHKAAVLALANLLERSGAVRVELDEWRTGRRRDWDAWARQHIRESDYVIVVASPMYRAVGDGFAPSDLHRGVQTEAAILREYLYEDRGTWLPRTIPVILPNRSPADLPGFVQPYTASHYEVDPITGDGVEMLLKVLTVRVPEPARVPPELAWTLLAEPVAVRWRADLLNASGVEPPGSTLELHLVPSRVTSRTPVSRLEELGGELAALGRSRGCLPQDEDLTTGVSDEVAGAFVTGRDAWSGLAVHREGQRSVWGPLIRARVGSVFDRDDVTDRLSLWLEALLAIELDPPGTVVPVAGLDPVGILREGPVDPSSPMTFPVGLPARVRLGSDDSVRFDVLRETVREAALELTARLARAISIG